MSTNRISRRSLGPAAVILISSLAIAWLVLADREDSDDAGTAQSNSLATKPAAQEERSLPNQGAVANPRVADLTQQGETVVEDGEVPAEQSIASLEVPTYFSNSVEYLETNKHWSMAFAAGRIAWVDRLDERFDQADEAVALDGESELARRAVLEHPGYSYTPSIALSSLTAECRNMICKVHVAPSHKYELVFDYVGRDPNTGLTSLDEVLFRYNFGHHVSKANSTTGVLTHYLLVNGFDLPASSR